MFPIKLTWKRALLSWAGFLLVFAGIQSTWIFRYYRLSSRASTTVGQIVDTAPHNGLLYSFSVSGKTYTGGTRTGVAGIDRRFLLIGSAVDVHYLPDRPDVNAVGDTHELLVLEIKDVVFSGTLFTVVLLIILSVRNAIARARVPSSAP